MMTARRFDTDSDALARRASLNSDNAAVSMEEWLWGLMPQRRYERVLDLGCGLGKQMFYLADRLPDAQITGLDISSESVDGVNRRAAKEGRPRLRAIELTLDTCVEYLERGAYDLIVSAYAIYYANDMLGLIRGLRDCMRPDGVAIILGYGAGSNDELFSIINESTASSEDKLESVQDFLTSDQIENLRSTYSSVQVARLANHVEFSSVDDVMSWWRNHNSHRPRVEEAVRKSLTERIVADGRFALSKNVLAVTLHV